MGHRSIETKYGPLEVWVHPADSGYVATVSSENPLPVNPVPEGSLAGSPDEAVAQLVAAIERTEPPQG